MIRNEAQNASGNAHVSCLNYNYALNSSTDTIVC